MWRRVVWCISAKFWKEPAASICRVEDENVVFIMKHNKITVYWDVTLRSQLTFRRTILLSFSVHRKDFLIYYANLKYNIPMFRYSVVCISVEPSCNFLWNFGTYIPNYKLLHFRREKPLYSRLWEANFYRMQVSSSRSTLYYLSTGRRVVRMLWIKRLPGKPCMVVQKLDESWQKGTRIWESFVFMYAYEKENALVV
jgi:hypothetical protein